MTDGRVTHRLRRRGLALTIAVLLAGLAATAGAATGFHRGLARDRQTRFDAAADRARDAVAGRLQLQLEDSVHLRNWMLLNPSATREQFHRFTALGFEEGLYPGVQAVTFAPKVSHEDLPRFEAAVQAETASQSQYPPFVVHPTGGGAASYVVTYIEPFAGNEGAFGFDLASDPSGSRASRQRATVAGRSVQPPSAW